jgi:hypothetical protein
VAVVVAATRAAGYAAGSPIYPPGNWSPALIAGVVASFAAYAIGLVLLARRPASARPVLALVAAIQLVPLASPLLLSRDPLVYLAWGRMSQPFEKDGAWPPIQTYGPLWSLIQEPIARLNGGVFGFRILAVLSVLALVALVWRLAERKVLAAAFIGWNPFVALHYAGGGHNDGVMMVFVLGALLLARTGRPELGGASWATSVAVKWSSGWFFFLWAIQRHRERKPIGLRGLLVAGAVLVAVACARYGLAWPNAFRSLTHELHIDHPSLGLLGFLEDARIPRNASLLSITLLEIAITVVFAWLAWQRRLRLGLAACFLVLVAPRLDPWYLLWPIALAAADDDDRWGRVLSVAITGWLMIDVFSTAAEA